LSRTINLSSKFTRILCSCLDILNQRSAPATTNTPSYRHELVQPINIPACTTSSHRHIRFTKITIIRPNVTLFSNIANIKRTFLTHRGVLLRRNLRPYSRPLTKSLTRSRSTCSRQHQPIASSCLCSIESSQSHPTCSSSNTITTTESAGEW
jgi:hypothetical protein